MRRVGQSGQLPDPAAMVRTLLERRPSVPPASGRGWPSPTAKRRTSPAQAAALGISKRGIGFEALDGEPVHIVFLLVAPTDAAGDHLKALAKISRLLKDRFFRQSLRDAKSAEAALKIINDEDEF
ncbi:MAG: PTS sugar transporter subunit IIA [Elusimicrobia bacterium]|nr:PTS sugar transporter subunit IIA [Elusimicrobiota bacterium]